MTPLEKLRDELAEKYYNGAIEEPSYCDFRAGFDSCLTALEREAGERMKTAIRKLDGIAGVNLLEPSEGDLERVVKAYAECRKERDELTARAEKAESTADQYHDKIQSLIARINAYEESTNQYLEKLAAAEAEVKRLTDDCPKLHKQDLEIIRGLEARIKELEADKLRWIKIEGCTCQIQKSILGGTTIFQCAKCAEATK